MLVVIFKTFVMKIPGGRTFVSASIANTVVDGIERFCGRIFTANSATSGVAAIKSVCSKYKPVHDIKKRNYEFTNSKCCKMYFKAFQMKRQGLKCF